MREWVHVHIKYQTTLHHSDAVWWTCWSDSQWIHSLITTKKWSWKTITYNYDKPTMRIVLSNSFSSTPWYLDGAPRVPRWGPHIASMEHVEHKVVRVEVKCEMAKCLRTALKCFMNSGETCWNYMHNCGKRWNIVKVHVRSWKVLRKDDNWAGIKWVATDFCKTSVMCSRIASKTSSGWVQRCLPAIAGVAMA